MEVTDVTSADREGHLRQLHENTAPFAVQLANCAEVYQVLAVDPGEALDRPCRLEACQGNPDEQIAPVEGVYTNVVSR